MADFNIEEYETLDDTYPYGSRLDLKDISSYHVGEYYCINRDQVQEENEMEYANLKLNHKASSIYVFVEGKINFLKINNESIKIFNN